MEIFKLNYEVFQHSLSLKEYAVVPGNPPSRHGREDSHALPDVRYSHRLRKLWEYKHVFWSRFFALFVTDMLEIANDGRGRSRPAL